MALLRSVGARGTSCFAVAGPFRKSPRRALQRLEAEERALDACRADRDAQILEDVLAVDGADLGERLALDLLREDRGRRLRDRAPLPLEAYVLHDVVIDEQAHRDLVA